MLPMQFLWPYKTQLSTADTGQTRWAFKLIQVTGPSSSGKLIAAAYQHSGRPQIKVTLSGFATVALIDTGAALCVMQLEMFQKLASSLHRSLLLQPAGPLQSVTGDSLDVVGSTQVSLDGGSLTNVQVPCVRSCNLSTLIIHTVSLYSF